MKLEDLASVSDCPFDVEIDGRTFTLHRIRTGDYAAIETKMKQERVALVLTGVAKVATSPELQALALANVVSKRVDMADIIMQASGRNMLLHRSLLRGDPTITLEAVEQLEELTFQQLGLIVDLISGVKTVRTGEEKPGPLSETESEPTGAPKSPASATTTG